MIILIHVDGGWLLRQKKCEPHRGDIASISFPLYFVRTAQCLSAVNGGDMHSLEKELRELNVSPATRKKNESNTAETPDRT